MAEFEPAIEITLINEGGLVDNPNDPGGVTKYGLSQRTYPSLDIRNLTVDQAKAIYLRDFWKFGGIISQAVANKIFDMYVNEEHEAIKIAQGILGLTQDGMYGPQTEQSVNNTDPADFLTRYRAALEQHYRNIVAANPKESVFLNGWLQRAAQ